MTPRMDAPHRRTLRDERRAADAGVPSAQRAGREPEPAIGQFRAALRDAEATAR